MSGAIPKPVMRHMHLAKTKRTFIELFVVTTAIVTAFKVFYIDPRNRRYEEFYQTYDCAAALKRMNEAGLMQSYPIE